MMRRFFIFACVFSFFSVAACEQILLFDADIVVHKDATLTVKEEITVYGCNQSVKHGILREFPTIYTDTLGNKHVIDFVLKEVLLNEKPIAHRVESKQNGKYIYIGDPHIYLPEGIYTFTLVYAVNRQIGFFDAHDELYWNVTGNGWRLPIKQVQARVMLPEGVDIAQIQVDGYTGLLREHGEDFEVDVARNGAVRFKSTRPFARNEGLTVVVGWPKGHVVPPSLLQKATWFFRDNVSWFFFLNSLILLLGFLIYIYRKNRARAGNGVVIPLFTAPDDMTPGAINYFNAMHYKDTSLSVEIVNMAVHGWLTIKQIKGPLVAGFLFGAQTFALEKKDDKNIDTFPLYRKLYDIFFASGDQFILDDTNARSLLQAKTIAQLDYDRLVDGMFHTNSGAFGWASFGALLVWFGIAYFGTSDVVIMGSAVAFFILLVVGYYVLRSYSREGYNVKREIDGFRMFLTVTEKDRLEIAGTPPMQTPELYEKYLPYAMALGVERQWTQKFNDIFKRLEAQGAPYVPMWYVGPRTHSFMPIAFAQGISKSVSSVISAASAPPASSSGFGGRSGGGGGGYSGGGGGGGGGGGW